MAICSKELCTGSTAMNVLKQAYLRVEQSFLQPLIYALMLLTTLPVHKLGLLPQDVDYNAKAVSSSLHFYPLVGLILGLILWALCLLWLHLFPVPVAAGLALLCWILLTGALHLDGLADSADAWLGGLGSKERTLRIMKDPNAGPAGVCAIVLCILLKYIALNALFAAESNALPALLIWPLILSRSTIPLIIISTPYARKNGIASPISTRYNMQAIILSSLLCTALLVLTLQAIGAALLVGCLMVTIGLRIAMLKRLSGYTGDTLGATIELCELSCLLVFCANL
ncbi:MAG: adenosylcobinamide-GDP ribazoletransferase [Phototrophicales bacterium]|nr:MAG: adenosylcobinamide-GDP ribazoletransferase [Phototrophicales bacterium]